MFALIVVIRDVVVVADVVEGQIGKEGCEGGGGVDLAVLHEVGFRGGCEAMGNVCVDKVAFCQKREEVGYLGKRRI